MLKQNFTFTLSNELAFSLMSVINRVKYVLSDSLSVCCPLSAVCSAGSFYLLSIVTCRLTRCIIVTVIQISTTTHQIDIIWANKAASIRPSLEMHRHESLVERVQFNMIKRVAQPQLILKTTRVIRCVYIINCRLSKVNCSSIGTVLFWLLLLVWLA